MFMLKGEFSNVIRNERIHILLATAYASRLHSGLRPSARDIVKRNAHRVITALWTEIAPKIPQIFVVI
jgi:hypothetical protein